MQLNVESTVMHKIIHEELHKKKSSLKLDLPRFNRTPTNGEKSRNYKEILKLLKNRKHHSIYKIRIGDETFLPFFLALQHVKKVKYELLKMTPTNNCEENN